MGFIDNEHLQVNQWARFKTCYAVHTDGDWVTVCRTTRSAKRGAGGLQHQVIFDEAVTPELDAWKRCAQIVQAEVADGSAWVAAAVPVHLAILRKLSAPFPSVNKALKVFPSLLDIDIPFPLEQCSYAFLDPIKGKDGQVEVNALAVRDTELDACLADLEKIDVRPSVVDHEGLALWSQVQLEQPASDADAARVLIWIGHSRTVVVAGQGSRLSHAHTIRVGAESLGQPGAPEKWHTRLQRFLKSLPAEFHRSKIQFDFVGPGILQVTEIEELVALVSESNPGLFPPQVVEGSEHVLARALSTRAMRQSVDPFNFLHGDHEDLALSRARQKRNLRTAITM